MSANTFDVATQFRETRVTRAWEIFRNTERVRGTTGVDTTGLSGWYAVCVRHRPADETKYC